MTSTSVDVELPKLPCDACLHDPRALLAGDSIHAVYCEHHRTGMALQGGLFTLYHPVTREQYQGIVAALDVRLEQIAEARAEQLPPARRPN